MSGEKRGLTKREREPESGAVRPSGRPSVCTSRDTRATPEGPGDSWRDKSQALACICKPWGSCKLHDTLQTRVDRRLFFLSTMRPGDKKWNEKGMFSPLFKDAGRTGWKRNFYIVVQQVKYWHIQPLLDKCGQMGFNAAPWHLMHRNMRIKKLSVGALWQIVVKSSSSVCVTSENLKNHHI